MELKQITSPELIYKIRESVQILLFNKESPNTTMQHFSSIRSHITYTS